MRCQTSMDDMVDILTVGNKPNRIFLAQPLSYRFTAVKTLHVVAAQVLPMYICSRRVRHLLSYTKKASPSVLVCMALVSACRYLATSLAYS